MKKGSQIFSFVFTIIFCVFAFALMTFFAIQKEPVPAADSVSRAEKNGEFYGENLLFELPFESVFLNIEQDKIGVYFVSENSDADILSQLGFTVTKTVKSDYAAFADMIDRLGGIELTDGGEPFLFTGVQIAEMLKSGAENSEKREITNEVLIGLSNEKSGTDVLRFILDNTETDLSFPEGYDIIRALPKAAQNINFINGEE